MITTNDYDENDDDDDYHNTGDEPKFTLKGQENYEARH